VFVRTTRSF